MATIHDQIEMRIRSFVNELNVLVRQAALESVSHALGGNRGEVSAARLDRSQKAALKTVAGGVPAAGTRPVPTRKGGRRSPEQMSRTLGAVRDYIVAHPGNRVEQIGPGLHLKTKDLSRPISKLLESGHIRREGEKRATKYFPGPQASAPLPATSGGGRPAAESKTKSKRTSKKPKK